MPPPTAAPLWQGHDPGSNNLWQPPSAPRRGPIILDDAELLEDAAADVRAVVAGDAPGIDEFVQPGALLRRERPSIAREKAVESGRRHERALERANRLGPVIRRDRVRIPGKLLPE